MKKFLLLFYLLILLFLNPVLSLTNCGDDRTTFGPAGSTTCADRAMLTFYDPSGNPLLPVPFINPGCGTYSYTASAVCDVQGNYRARFNAFYFTTELAYCEEVVYKCCKADVGDGCYPDLPGLCVGYDYISYSIPGFGANQCRDYTDEGAFPSAYTCSACQVTKDAWINSMCSEGFCRAPNGGAVDVSTTMDKNLSVDVQILNTGLQSQANWLVGVEFWFVDDYTNYMPTRHGRVNSWFDSETNTYGCTDGSGNPITGYDCGCSVTGDDDLDPMETKTITCWIEGNYWYSDTTGTERIMMAIHERDKSADAGNNGNSGNDWWTDAFVRVNPVPLRYVLTTVCGDGFVGGSETCDPKVDLRGNSDPHDACECYEACDDTCTCHDIRPEMVGCDYFDNCNTPSCNWWTECYTADPDPDVIDFVVNVCPDSFTSCHVPATCSS